MQVLLCIATFVGVVPSLFHDFYEEFFVRPSDNQAIRAVKLDILTQVATETSINAILEELQVCSCSYPGSSLEHVVL